MTHSKLLQVVCPSRVAFVVRLGLGLVLIYGCLAKIRRPYDFLGHVYGYEIVGPKLGLWVAMTVPWFELVLGICLVAGLFIHGALLGTTVLMSVFTFAQASALHRGLSISCGCFSGAGDGRVSYWTLIRAGVLLVASLAAYSIVLWSTVKANPKAAAPHSNRETARISLPAAEPVG